MPPQYPIWQSMLSGVLTVILAISAATQDEWVSSDAGETWVLQRDLTPDSALCPGWRFNNIQPVMHADGRPTDRLLIF